MASLSTPIGLLTMCDPKATWPLSDPAAYWDGNVALSDKQYVFKKAQEVKFEDTYRTRVDRAHWAEFKAEMKQGKKAVAYFVHMLKAFEAGDRFIVAKLAYDGGAA